MPNKDPRIETLLDWAQLREPRVTPAAERALAALEGSAPGLRTAPALARIAAAAYGRVPRRGTRDLRTGHRVVALLAAMGEAGASELVRLRDTVSYKLAERRIVRELARCKRELGTPTGELEDGFSGPEPDHELTVPVAVGPFKARLTVADDLNHVRTVWQDASGLSRPRRPTRATEHPMQLAELDDERRQLRSYLTALRQRLEQLIANGRSWSAEEWTTHMFSTPLRSEMARRMIWRIGRDDGVLALPGPDGLRRIDGVAVPLSRSDTIALWHPAEDPELQAAWRARLDDLGIRQPVAQATRAIVLADPDSPVLRFACGTRVTQTAFRGFLLKRGWRVPYLGPWDYDPEATLRAHTHDPTAVLEVELDLADHWESTDLVLGNLSFRSALDTTLDARVLPPVIVSEAARDVLGAIAAAAPSSRVSRDAPFGADH